MNHPPFSRRHLLQIGAIHAAALSAPAWSQASAPYPARPIELIVPWQAGGGADVVARAYGVAVGKHLPQPVVVVNKPGATGVLGMNDVVHARPDGYKLLLATPELTFLNHLGLGKFSYGDVRAIARLNADPIAIVVRADAPHATLNAFLETARKPGANVRVGNAGHGSTLHMAAAALCLKTGIEFNHIPFAGGAPAILALLGGHLDAVSVTTAEVASYIAAGKLQVLAIMAEQRLPDLAQVPTCKELGIDLSLSLWRGLCAPKSTPDAVMGTLRAATLKAAAEPVMQETLRKLHFSTDSYADDVRFGNEMARESALFKTLVAQLGLASK